ncbi:helix-turn-helix domain-containing protein [Cohnella thailandensis]|uniref:Helix-turn-helix transcriptional regulator n=1 Tax=Cohnella thailandensis TaxID=557557 RepID=A0A841T045_9BACL|nr:helix-turn-helix transcriptional regulator [Cohnella thailandensis]MBB6637514.1 helix-turn-helix transcriptional regulator [Cohnella thailandensis]MBP1977547.1 transcriptional regulator with XRE-family HTH domain [Cohnella thailandensis]
MNILEDFGLRLKELRLRSGMSQDMLAARSGLDRTYIGGVERGERNISLKNIELLCNTLDIDIRYFFDQERFSLNSAQLKRELERPLKERFFYRVDSERNLITWQVVGALSVDEIKGIVAELKAACRPLRLGKVKLLIDNRRMMSKGQPLVFQHEITERWEELQRWFLPRCEEVVVLCNSRFMQNQMNRLAKRSGIIAVQKSLFREDEEWLTAELDPISYFESR